jgi:uncharacterized membrane protein
MKDLWTINAMLVLFSGYMASISTTKTIFWLNVVAVAVNFLAVVFHFAT